MKFIRSEGHKLILATALRGMRRDDEASLLLKYSASFASWRWKTLCEATKKTWKIRFVVDVWKKALFRNSQDPAELDIVDTAMGDQRFWRETCFVKLFAGWLDR